MNEDKTNLMERYINIGRNLARHPWFPYWIVFSLFGLIGYFLRFWGLGDYPEFIYRDESWNGVEGLITLRDMDFRPFYEGSTGREGMLIWMIAIVHYFFEPSAFAVRFAPALIGLVTVLSLPICSFFLLRFFQRSSNPRIELNTDHHIFLWIALFAMFFLATSYWHVNFSRITFRAILDPLFSMYACTLVALSYQYSRQYWLHIVTGIVCGLGLYGYGAFKFTVIPLACIFFYAVFCYRNKVILPSVIITIFAMLVAYPLVSYIFHNGDNYFLRLNQVSIFKKENPLGEFFDGFFKLLGMLGGIGDRNLRHNTNSNAQLNIVNFAFLLYGVVVLVKLYIFNRENSSYEKAISYLGGLALIWFLVMLVPSALTYDAQPHALRAIGIILPVVIIAAIGAATFFFQVHSLLPNSGRVNLYIFFAVIVTSITYATATEHFYRYQRYPGMKNWFDTKANQAALNINRASPNKSFLVVVKDRHSPETRSVIQNFRYLTNLKMDHKLHNNIIRLRELSRHPLRNSAIIYTPRDIESSVKKIIRDRHRIKRY